MRKKFLSAMIGAGLLFGWPAQAAQFLSLAAEHRESPWTRYYTAGSKAADKRSPQAEKLLLEAIKEAKLGAGHAQELEMARNRLGYVYLNEDKFEQAEPVFNSALNAARRVFGETSLETASSLHGMATIDFLRGKYKRAEELAREAVKIREKNQPATNQALAASYILLGRIMEKTGFADDGEPLIKQGVTLLDGDQSLDTADALRAAARFYQSTGNREEAQELYKRSFDIKDSHFRIDQPASLRGLVRYTWEPGSPRSAEISDVDFPVRYITVNGVRVAVTVLDLWELIGVLVCVTNVSEHTLNIGLGHPKIERIDLDQYAVIKQAMEEVDPKRIDRIRRERQMWDLTRNRPWLANMQKTRTLRGLVPEIGHDLFRGANTFGVWGDWNAQQKTMATDKFTQQYSPEQLQLQSQQVADPIKARDEIPGLPFETLDPFESRTGELFFMNPRAEKVLVTVPIGNATIEVPFNCHKRRIN